MGMFKTSFATERVRRYLLQMVLRGGSQPVRLPTDRELTETLGLSRVTVRRAVSELCRGCYILKIPGKQGIYTNPAMAEITLHSIGILRSSNYIHNRELSILGAMGEELMRRKCFYSMNFFMLHDASAATLARELRSSGLDCMISFEPSPLVESLLDQGIPLLTVEHFGYPERVSRNFFGTDEAAAGRAAAQAVAHRQFRNILYCGSYPEMRRVFQETLSGSAWIDCIDGTEKPDVFLQILKRKKYDAVIGMMREIGIRKLYDALHELNPAVPPEIYLYPWPESELFREGNPAFPTVVFDTAFFQGQLKKLGQALADGVIRLLAGEAVSGTLINPIHFNPKRRRRAEQ